MKRNLLLCLIFISTCLNAQITLGTGSTATGTAPVSTYYRYSYVQQILSKQEINANIAGNITGLRFYTASSSSITNSSSWTVYLGTTTKTTFSSAADWVPVAQLTQVFSGTVTNANGTVSVAFPVPFAYNNINNLVIAVKENSAGYDENGFNDVFYVYGSAPNSVIYYRNDTVNPNPSNPPAGVLTDKKSVVTLTGLVPSSTIACPTVLYPGNNATFIPLSPTISWNAVPGATGYKVSLGTTLGGTDIISQQSVTANNFTVPQVLSNNTVYYARVTAVGAANESQGCSNMMFRTVPGLPVNDECANAISLTVNPDANCVSVSPGYTLGATNSGLAPAPCIGNPDDDVWFKFVATSTSHKISLNNITSVGTANSTDTYFQVFGGACGNLTSIFCSDPASSIISGLNVGSTYYIRVYSYDGVGNHQIFNICVATIPPPPANDACSGALQANVLPYSYTQSDAAGATNNSGFVTACSTNGMNDGTWFSFTGNGGVIDIVVSMPSGSNFDPQIGVFTGTCGALSCVNTVDAGEDGELESLSVQTVAGTTYYVNVGHYSNSDDELEDTFTIAISTDFLGTSETGDHKREIQIYPNPFTDLLNISEAENIKSVMITDMAGRTVKMINNPGSSLHLSDLKSGMYILTILKNDGSKQSLKMIKK